MWHIYCEFLVDDEADHRLTLMALGNAFAQYTTSVYTPYATSAFKSHSLLASANVVNRVFSMVAYAIVRFTPEAIPNVRYPN